MAVGQSAFSGGTGKNSENPWSKDIPAGAERKIDNPYVPTTPTTDPPITPSTDGLQPNPTQALTYEEAQAAGYGGVSAYTQYAGTGIPIIRGYYDDAGNFNFQENVAQAEQLLELRNVDYPSFEEYLASSGLGGWQDTSGALGNIGGLADLLEQAGTVGTDQYNSDLAAQNAYAAEQAGFTSPEEYEQWLENYRNTGVSDMEGLSVEQRDVYNRAFQQEINATRQDYMDMVNALGVESTSRAFAAMDEATGQIANLQIQHAQTMMNADMAQRQLEYEAFAQRASQLMDIHSEEKAFLQAQMYNNRMGALEAYATQLSGMLQSNANLLSAYSADMQAIKYNADTIYNSIMADIGVEDALLNQSAQEWEQEYASYYQDLEAQALAAEQSASNVSTVLSVIGVFAGAILLAFNPVAGAGLMGGSISSLAGGA